MFYLTDTHPALLCDQRVAGKFLGLARIHAALALLLSACLFVSASAEVLIELDQDLPEVKENVHTHLRIHDRPCDTPEQTIQQLFKTINKEAQAAVQALGYYQAKIDSELEQPEACWQVNLRIQLGPPVRVRSLDIRIEGEGKDDTEFQALLSNLPVKTGDILHHGKYEAIKTSLQELALQRGYLDAALMQRQLKVDPSALAADISLSLASGIRYRFGQLHLGNQPLDPRLVEKLAGYTPGAYYDANVLSKMDRNLSQSGYYDSVEVRLRRADISQGEVPVEVNFEPRPRHSWRTGAGYATDSGPRVSLGYDNRFVTRGGHRFNADLRLSPVLSTLSTDYHIPGSDPHVQKYRISAALEHEDTDTSTSDSLRLGFFDSRRTGSWNRNRFLTLLTEQSSIGDEEISAVFLMPGIGYDTTVADDPLRTRRGYRFNAEIKGAHEAALSSASLLQLKLGAKGIYRIGDGGRFTARVDFGTTLTDQFQELPASLRFFAGGDNSVRGYDFESLGPRNAADEVVGGKHLLTSTLEYEHPVYTEDWWAAVFVDAGNAFNSSDVEFKQGYGMGLRWYSPVGRIRLDLAFPSDTTTDQWRIHFGLGVDL